MKGRVGAQREEKPGRGGSREVEGGPSAVSVNGQRAAGPGRCSVPGQTEADKETQGALGCGALQVTCEGQRV